MKDITLDLCKRYFPTRNLDSNKYEYGHVLVIGGSLGMSGAPVLSSMAALRTGVGLVTLATASSIVNVVSSFAPEIMTLPLIETSHGCISEKAFDIIKNFILNRKVDAIAIGMGISRDVKTMDFVYRIVEETDIPIVLDGDGLFVFSDENYKIGQKFARLGREKLLCVTPHYKEMARLTGLSVEEIMKNKSQIVKDFARINKCICVLKGYETLISDGETIYKNITGNPGMATAGSGDVLSGMISGLVSRRGIDGEYLERIAAAVFLHGLAGDIARDEVGEESLIASDIIKFLPKIFLRICEG